MSEPIFTIQTLTKKDLQSLNDLRNFYHNADLDKDAQSLIRDFNALNREYQKSLKSLISRHEDTLRVYYAANYELLNTGYEAYWNPQTRSYIKNRLSAKDLTETKAENNKITKLLDKLSTLWIKVNSLRNRLDS